MSEAAQAKAPLARNARMLEGKVPAAFPAGNFCPAASRKSLTRFKMHGMLPKSFRFKGAFVVKKRKQSYKKKTCIACGREFNTPRAHAKTCSPRCRTRLSRSRQGRASTDAGVTLAFLDNLLLLLAEGGE